jgi:hypothetical protein
MLRAGRKRYRGTIQLSLGTYSADSYHRALDSGGATPGRILAAPVPPATRRLDG